MATERIARLRAFAAKTSKVDASVSEFKGAKETVEQHLDEFRVCLAGG
jgi:hypothetical protein